MAIIEITDLSAEELRPYACTSELELLRSGIFIAESPKVIRTALDSGYEPVSLLMEKKYLSGQAADIAERCGGIPIYTASSQLLTELTGYKLTQGVLCAMGRKKLPAPADILAGADRIAVLEDVMNQTNIGAIFRSAAALGFDAIVLTSACSDPFFRRTVRVSMGTVFQLPWTYLSRGAPDYIGELKAMGFACAAMALRKDTVRIDDVKLRSEEKLAVILGTEGTGLKEATIDRCDYTIKIPMAHGVDSLNVAAASAVAFWQLSKNISE
ncbi:TrmH family RNA methyltransferase [Ruminococcus flavefaciens]|uniref:TrmH family RNA methyltransferase n=1 Tax=Ruminococcus flavefaciens TaxID=1265 RepID=UPI000463A081